MEEIYQQYSPQDKGWYLCLKNDDTPVAFFAPNPHHEDKYIITIPWDFSGNPNNSHVFNPKTWIVTEIDRATKNITNWEPLKQILPLKDCISPNVELEMAYRKSLVGSTIKIDGTNYKILDTYHHINSWTIFNIENEETKQSRQVQLQNYDDWSFGGIDKIDVEILND